MGPGSPFAWPRRLRPHRRVLKWRKNAHGFDRYSRDIPAFPAQWLYGLYVLSPVSGLFCHRRQRDTSRQLDATVAAPGPHDFAVRYGVFVRRKNTPDAAASIASRAQRIVTIAKRPSDGLETARVYA